MKTLCVGYDKRFLDHRPPPGTYHPENPDRLTIALSALERCSIPRRSVPAPQEVSREPALEIHDKSYVRLVEELSSRGFEWIDPDTYVSPGTWRAALAALALTRRLLELLLEGSCGLAIALVRPPGHHAGRVGRALGAPTQGFCIFNNIASVAALALSKGLSPVLIVDVDVHHGNGTQEIFWEEPRVVHVDLHGDYLYPGTGDVSDIGGGDGRGSKVNVPLPPGSRNDDYLYVFQRVVAPLASVAKPRVLLVSAGFDAYEGDGLASMLLNEEGYRGMGRALACIALRYSSAAPLLVLEGGYSEGLDKGLPAMLRGLAEGLRGLCEEEMRARPSPRVERVVGRVLRILREFYGDLR